MTDDLRASFASFDSLNQKLKDSTLVLLDSFGLLEFRLSIEDHYSKGLMYIIDQWEEGAKKPPITQFIYAEAQYRLKQSQSLYKELSYELIAYKSQIAQHRSSIEYISSLKSNIEQHIRTQYQSNQQKLDLYTRVSMEYERNVIVVDIVNKNVNQRYDHILAIKSLDNRRYDAYMNYKNGVLEFNQQIEYTKINNIRQQIPHVTKLMGQLEDVKVKLEGSVKDYYMRVLVQFMSSMKSCSYDYEYISKQLLELKFDFTSTIKSNVLNIYQVQSIEPLHTFLTAKVESIAKTYSLSSFIFVFQNNLYFSQQPKCLGEQELKDTTTAFQDFCSLIEKNDDSLEELSIRIYEESSLEKAILFSEVLFLQLKRPINLNRKLFNCVCNLLYRMISSCGSDGRAVNQLRLVSGLLFSDDVKQISQATVFDDYQIINQHNVWQQQNFWEWYLVDQVDGVDEISQKIQATLIQMANLYVSQETIANFLSDSYRVYRVNSKTLLELQSQIHDYIQFKKQNDPIAQMQYNYIHSKGIESLQMQ